MVQKKPMLARIRSYVGKLFAPPTYEELMEEQLFRDEASQVARSYANCWGK